MSSLAGQTKHGFLEHLMRFSKSSLPPRLRHSLGRQHRFFIHVGWSIRCLVSRTPVTGDADVVVSMTSHGARIAKVHHALESIARGRVRPSRMILWIDEELEGHALPRGLRRLEHRGLEVRYHKDDIGPHMKYYPYVMGEIKHDRPLVTGDDDKRYSKEWLHGLVEACRSEPGAISVYISRRIEFIGDEFSPYLTWPFVNTTTPDRRNAVIGFCGAIYPPEFLDALRKRGDGFRDCCLRNDDIWLTYVAVTEGFPVRQIHPAPLLPGTLPGAEALALRRTNLVGGTAGGGNDQQLLDTFKRNPRQLFEQAGSNSRPQ